MFLPKLSPYDPLLSDNVVFCFVVGKDNTHCLVQQYMPLTAVPLALFSMRRSAPLHILALSLRRPSTGYTSNVDCAINQRGFPGSNWLSFTISFPLIFPGPESGLSLIPKIWRYLISPSRSYACFHTLSLRLQTCLRPGLSQEPHPTALFQYAYHSLYIMTLYCWSLFCLFQLQNFSYWSPLTTSSL